MWSPTMRAIASVDPPAANGTIRVIERSGKAAVAGPAPATSASAAMPDAMVLATGRLIGIKLSVTALTREMERCMKNSPKARIAPDEMASPPSTTRGQQLSYYVAQGGQRGIIELVACALSSGSTAVDS